MVELLLVLGIMGILALAIAPNILQYRNQQLLDTTTQQIAASIRDAQNRSITQQDGLPWGIYFNNTTTDAYTVFSGATYASSASAYTRVYTSLDSPIVFTKPSPGNSVEIDFAQLSGLPSASTSVTITNGFASNTIYIASSGIVTY